MSRTSPAYSERESPDRPLYRRPGVGVAGVVALVLTVLLLDPRTVLGPVETALRAALPLAALGAVGAAGYWVYTRRRRAVAAAKTPQQVFEVEASEDDDGEG